MGHGEVRPPTSGVFLDKKWNTAKEVNLSMWAFCPEYSHFFSMGSPLPQNGTTMFFLSFSRVLHHPGPPFHFWDSSLINPVRLISLQGHLKGVTPLTFLDFHRIFLVPNILEKAYKMCELWCVSLRPHPPTRRHYFHSFGPSAHFLHFQRFLVHISTMVGCPWGLLSHKYPGPPIGQTWAAGISFSPHIFMEGDPPQPSFRKAPKKAFSILRGPFGAFIYFLAYIGPFSGFLVGELAYICPIVMADRCASFFSHGYALFGHFLGALGPTFVQHLPWDPTWAYSCFFSIFFVFFLPNSW